MKRDRKIIAIGGGQVFVPCHEPTTLAIDKEAVRLAVSELPLGRETVNVLFIPTASQDDMGYCNSIYTLFTLRLGCNYEHLCLFSSTNTPKLIKDRLAWADIIYVGGGNTAMMMKLWRENGVDTLFRKAHSEGKVLMGLSAGSICWFESGLSDSEKLSGNSDWKPTWVTGLGFLPMLHSPHIDSEEWRKSELLWRCRGGEITKPVLALEDNCAIEVIGNQYRIIASQPGKAASLFSGNKVADRLMPTEEFFPLGSLK